MLEMLGRQQQTAPSYADMAVAATVGGGIQGVAATPIELVKIQMQASSTGQFSLTKTSLIPVPFSSTF